MSKFKLYTFFLADGTRQPLYGPSADEALTNAGYSTSWIAENVKEHRGGLSDDFEFINGKWHPKKTAIQSKYN